MTLEEGMDGAVLGDKGYRHIGKVAGKMRDEAGLDWLADIIDAMKNEDPWQEGPWALKIAIEWEKTR